MMRISVTAPSRHVFAMTGLDQSKRVVAPPFVSILLPSLGLCCRLLFTCLKHTREGK